MAAVSLELNEGGGGGIRRFRPTEPIEGVLIRECPCDSSDS